jgi:hypothetical protein
VTQRLEIIIIINLFSSINQTKNNNNEGFLHLRILKKYTYLKFLIMQITVSLNYILWCDLLIQLLSNYRNFFLS